MIVKTLMLALTFAVGWLWWNLSRARHDKVALLAENSRLRSQLRTLRG